MKHLHNGTLPDGAIVWWSGTGPRIVNRRIRFSSVLALYVITQRTVAIVHGCFVF